jgi:lactate/malate dehydrogenase, NAD binding domain
MDCGQFVFSAESLDDFIEALSLSLCLHQGHVGDEQLGEALNGASVVIIPAGVPRKPGMTRDDLFKVQCPRACHITGSAPGCLVPNQH